MAIKERKVQLVLDAMRHVAEADLSSTDKLICLDWLRVALEKYEKE